MAGKNPKMMPTMPATPNDKTIEPLLNQLIIAEMVRRILVTNQDAIEREVAVRPTCQSARLLNEPRLGDSMARSPWRIG